MSDERCGECGNAKIVAHCEKCGRAYVWVNPGNPDPRCLVTKCDGRIVLDARQAEPSDK